VIARTPEVCNLNHGSAKFFRDRKVNILGFAVQEGMVKSKLYTGSNSNSCTGCDDIKSNDD